MASSLVATERRLLQREPALIAVAVFFLLLVCAAAFLGAGRVKNERQTIAAAQKAFAEKRVSLRNDAVKAAGMPDAAPSAPDAPQAAPGASAGPVAFTALPAVVALEPQPLGFVAIGLSDLKPPLYKVTVTSPYKFMTTYELDNPLLMSIGGFDVAFVMLFLLPMVILAMNYNLLSADRDAGIMAMVLAQPVKPGHYVGARIAVRGGATGLLVIIGWALSLWIAGVGFTDFGASLLLLLVLLVYAAFWVVLALGVNILIRSSATCGVVLAGLWLLFVVLVPTGTALIATSAIKSPSRAALTADARDAAQKADRERAASLANYYFDHPDMAAAAPKPGAGDPFSRGIVLSDRAVEKAIEPTLAAFETAANRRQEVVEGLQLLSPTLIAQIAIEDIAGRGNRKYSLFTRQVMAFHQRWSAIFTPKIMGSGKLSPADYDALPIWRFTPAGGFVLNSLNAAALAGLGVLIVLAALTLLERARRLSP